MMAAKEITEVYEKLFGFVPAPTKERHSWTLEVRPDDLELHESFRKNCMQSEHIPEKYVQLMLFGMLLMVMAPGAKVHLIASRRAGATWDELYDVMKLAFLFRGLSAANLGTVFMEEVRKMEEEQGESALSGD
ncbi:hypothetical protein [Paenibacillus sp. FSL H8-0537]|uniref:carboxymuconolactone decarboxylase family protein n=1 Tax=Paenibacillus sp. FSL H8-0537 TaxID=2921399 RepID=UPI0031019560